MKKAKWLILTLTFVVCLAVYLNWQYVRAGNDSNQINSDAIYVTDAEESEHEYFVNARYTRKKSRDEALDTLRELVEETSTDAETAAKANEGINDYAVITEREMVIENLVRAKGYADCVTFLSSTSANVIVNAKNLSATDVALISDIVVGQTELSYEAIKVIAVE